MLSTLLSISAAPGPPEAVSAAFSRNLRAFAQAATPIASRNSIEARIVDPLTHPNTVTTHSVEAIDGVHLLTMELVEGQSLARLIPAGGIPVERPPSVHRDLKPENVMETTVERTVKVGGYANNFMI